MKIFSGIAAAGALVAFVLLPAGVVMAQATPNTGSETITGAPATAAPPATATTPAAAPTNNDDHHRASKEPEEKEGCEDD